MIVDYFTGIRDTIHSFDHVIEDFRFTEKIFSKEKGFISGRLVFLDNSILEFGEVRNTNLPGKIKYRYHYMSSSGQLFFRYDNAKHHPDIESFPHHKHTPISVIPSNEPDILSVLREIEEIILKEN